MSNPGKTNVSPSSFAANPKDPPPGSSDWVAAKNSGTSTSGKGGGPKWTIVRPSGRGPMGTILDPEDFPALVPPAGSSTDLPDYEDAMDDQEMEVEQGQETPTDNFWSNYTGIWGNPWLSVNGQHGDLPITVFHVGRKLSFRKTLPGTLPFQGGPQLSRGVGGGSSLILEGL